MKESTPDQWERYWSERETDVGQVYSNEDRILQQLEALPVQGWLVVEVGAGSGRDSIELARRGAQAVVLDYVASSFRVIRGQAEQAKASVLCVCADATRMPFRDESFDLVFHQGLLEHFRDPGPLLEENRRVLKPGGYCLIDVPQRYHVYTLAKHIMIALNRWFAGWETEFTVRGLERLVERHGFSVERAYGDWMVPGFFYRSLRYGLFRARIARLPLYPRPIWPFGAIGRALREALRRTRWGFYTCAMIGVLCRRSAAKP